MENEKDPLKARIAHLEDQLIRAFNERDKASLIEAQVNLRAALEEKERREFDLNWKGCTVPLAPIALN